MLMHGFDTLRDRRGKSLLILRLRISEPKIDAVLTGRTQELSELLAKLIFRIRYEQMKGILIMKA